MKKRILSLTVVSALFLASCGAEKETPETVAKKWCELNQKVKNASDEEAREKAREEREKYEEEIENKYPQDDEKNKEFWDKVMDETKGCD